jgi:hypothetical protein
MDVSLIRRLDLQIVFVYIFSVEEPRFHFLSLVSSSQSHGDLDQLIFKKNYANLFKRVK